MKGSYNKGHGVGKLEGGSLKPGSKSNVIPGLSERKTRREKPLSGKWAEG